MPQPLNPYAPILTPGESPPEALEATVDPSAGIVSFECFIDEECWHRIREVPPPRVHSWALAWSMIGLSLGLFALVSVTSIQQTAFYLYGPIQMTSFVIGLFGLIFLIVCWEMRRVANSSRQHEVQPWCRGNIHGQISATRLTIHSDTVSLAIPAYVVTKLQWRSDALQVSFGPISIPADPQRRISIPETAFSQGPQTVLPLPPLRHATMKEMSDQQCQHLVDDLIASLPQPNASLSEPNPRPEWWLPIDNHLRWNDLEWLKARTTLRRMLQLSVGLVIATYLLFLFRAVLLPETWRPRDDALTRTLQWMFVPLGATILYGLMYHLPMVAGRSILRLQGMIAGDRTEQNRLICLRTGLFAVAYRGKPTQYSRWTEHGLEFWAEPNRMLFVIPKRVFPADEHPAIAEVFAGSDEPVFDSPQTQHWEGPQLLPGGGIPPHQR